MNTTAIAQHLNIVESAITRCEEWANVLFVVAKGIGARFVSKKINVEEEKMEELESHTFRVEDGSWGWKVGQKYKSNGRVMEIVEIVDETPCYELDGVTYTGDYYTGRGSADMEWTNQTVKAKFVRMLEI
jgi:hypothetical protein